MKTNEVSDMKLDLLKELYLKNNLVDGKWNEALTFMNRMQTYVLVTQLAVDVDDIQVDQIDVWVQYLLKTHQNSIEHFIIMMRYFRVTKNNDLFIHLTKYTGKLDVAESIYQKLEKVAGKQKKEEIERALPIPELGTDLLEITHYTERLMEHLKTHLAESDMLNILTDNHHQIPRTVFNSEKIIYEASNSLEDYLIDLHQRKIEELKTFEASGRIWYEQEITKEVIEFVSGNQEIMSAVLKDDTLFITKIPYDTPKYLHAATNQEKAYYMCHCPFARESILKSDVKIDSRWCYCSAGFTKLPFDVVLDQDLKIQCLNSALAGDSICRFSISLHGIEYKK
jgi:hypothetical protein